MDSNMDRRSLLRWAALALMGLISAPIPGRASCAVTGDNPQGPLYVPGAPFTNKLNVDGEKGRPLTVSGRVFSSKECKPLGGAVLDVWHANADGQYYGLEFYSSGALGNGLLRGKIECGPDGRYSFSTILPGYFKITPTRVRPRHIHVIAKGPDGSELVTQLYFKGDKQLEGNTTAKPGLIMEVEEKPTGLTTNFDFYL
jgi:protocatechuate 3,4-dioxygenase beta subunit